MLIVLEWLLGGLLSQVIKVVAMRVVLLGLRPRLVVFVSLIGLRSVLFRHGELCSVGIVAVVPLAVSRAASSPFDNSLLLLVSVGRLVLVGLVVAVVVLEVAWRLVHLVGH